MQRFVRRSNLMLPITVRRFVESAWRHNADAVTLDLEDGVPRSQKVEARSYVPEAVPVAGRSAAEVFVRVNKPYLYADLEAAVWPGLSGIMLPKIEQGDTCPPGASDFPAPQCFLDCGN